MARGGTAKKAGVKSTDAAAARAAASIHDVATAARVSIATVSRVMNSPHLVSAKTAARVQEVIRDIGYAPNPFAQGLITRSSRVLGIALPDIHGEFYSELLRGADAEASGRGYHLLVTSENKGRGGKGSRNGGLGFGLIDGVAVMIADADNSLSRAARETSLPTVVLDSDLHERGVDSVVVDNAGGTREAARHLLSGTRGERLFFVGGPPVNFDSQQRAAAFQAALRESGVSVRSEQVAFGEYTPEWGASWAGANLSKEAGGGPVGVLAGNDEIAIGVLQAAADRGLRVPEQVRIVGFDDTRLASLIRPRLSSVRVPMAEVGAAAVRLLVRRIDDRSAGIECVRLPTSLVVRESSATA
jgi:LacI family transcriptional regulator